MQRRLMAPFYTPRGVQEFAEIMLRDTVDMTERWNKLATTQPEVEMFDEMALITASIILKAVFSTKSEEDVLQIKDCVETLISYGTDALLKPLRLPDWMPTPRNNRYRKARETVHRYINAILDTLLAMNESEYPDDLLSKLIVAKDPESGERMSRELLPGYQAKFVMEGILHIHNGLPMLLKNRQEQQN